MKKYIYLIIILFSSCYTKQAAIRKFCNQKYITAVIDTSLSVSIPKPVDDNEFNTDSLMLIKLLLAKSDSLICIYEDSLIKVQAVKAIVPDSNGQLKPVVKFTVREKPGKKILVKVPIKIPVVLPCNCPPPPALTYKDHVKTAMAWSGAVFWLLLLVAIVLYLIIRKQ